jgi:hypothetical protein
MIHRILRHLKWHAACDEADEDLTLAAHAAGKRNRFHVRGDRRKFFQTSKLGQAVHSNRPARWLDDGPVSSETVANERHSKNSHGPERRQHPTIPKWT